MSHKLSKTTYLLGLQCPLRLWRRDRDIPEAPPEEMPYDAAEDFADEAKRVEEVARNVVGQQSPFQVELETPDCRVVADFLLPVAGGHRLIEVKASSKVKPLHLRDLTFQWAVAEAAGKPIHAAEVIHVNKEYILGPEGLRPDQLLRRVDVTKEVQALLPQTRADIQRLFRVMRAEKAPVVAPGTHCKGYRDSKEEVRPSDCGHLLPGALCREELPADWANELPNLRGAARAAVDALPEPRRIAHLQADAPTWTPEQRRFIQAHHAGGEIVDGEGLAADLAAFQHPSTAFMDFEFDPFVAVPRFAGMKPFQRLPFQWAMRRADQPSREFAFLHDGSDDPRRAFIDSLLAALPTEGPIVVYSAPAESKVLRHYVEDWFQSEYADRVNDVLHRLVDLLDLVKGHYAHPAMKGSFSLKRAAPAVLGRGYDGLEISDGMAAVRAWRKLSAGTLPPAEAKSARENLSAYCGKDAVLMAEILQRLEAFAGPEPLHK